MSKSDLFKLVGNIQGAKALIQEIQDSSPQLKAVFNEFFRAAKKDKTKDKNQQIYEAIKFATDKIKRDPNIILGCDSEDPPELKKEIYYLKSRYYHPDGFNPDQNKFMRIKEAYDRIKDNKGET